MTGVTSTQSTVAKPQSDVKQVFQGAAEKVKSSLEATQEAAYDAAEKFAQSAKKQEVKRPPIMQQDALYSGAAIKEELERLEANGVQQWQILEILRGFKGY